MGEPRPVVTSFSVSGGKWVNLNGSHMHPRAHQALMTAWKALAVNAIRAQECVPIDPPVVITATVRRTRNVRSDAHNVTPTIKACIDAAVEAGLIPDDHDGIVRRLIIEPGPKAARPTIEIKLECA